MLSELKKNILESKTPNDLPIKIVAIDGHGGSGKTTLARLLSDELKAEVLHTDDFASYDNPLEWWPRLINEALEPVKNGARKLSYERGSWYKNHQPAPVVCQPVTSILIIEGVSASRSEFRPYLSYAIWVETPKNICLQRGVKRDLLDNGAGKSRKEIENDWKGWHKYEQEYVNRDDPRTFADIIVDGTKEFN